MLKITIPGKGDLSLEKLVLDFNGTIALDGKVLPEAATKINRLAHLLEIHILTADTFGSVIEECRGLPALVKVLKSSNHTEEKGKYIKDLAGGVAAIGNGANDSLLLKNADLAILISGAEGCSTASFLNADLFIEKIEDALDLLLKPQRLIATLRE